jgi:hypothetical protein
MRGSTFAAIAWVVFASRILVDTNADVPPYWDNCVNAHGALFPYEVPVWVPFLAVPPWVTVQLRIDGSWTINPPPSEWPFQRQYFASHFCAKEMCAFLRSSMTSSGTIDGVAPLRPSEYSMLEMHTLFQHSAALSEYGADLPREDSRYSAGVSLLHRALERASAVPNLALPFSNASVAATFAADAFSRCASINGSVHVGSFCDTINHNSLTNNFLLCRVHTIDATHHHHPLLRDVNDFDLLTLAFGSHHPYNAALRQALERPLEWRLDSDEL